MRFLTNLDTQIAAMVVDGITLKINIMRRI